MVASSVRDLNVGLHVAQEGDMEVGQQARVGAQLDGSQQVAQGHGAQAHVVRKHGEEVPDHHHAAGQLAVVVGQLPCGHRGLCQSVPEVDVLQTKTLFMHYLSIMQAGACEGNRSGQDVRGHAVCMQVRITLNDKQTK